MNSKKEENSKNEATVLKIIKPNEINIAKLIMNSKEVIVEDGQFKIGEVKNFIRKNKNTLEKIVLKNCYSQKMKRFEIVQTLFLESDLLLIEFPALKEIKINGLIVNPSELEDQWKQHYQNLFESSVRSVDSELRVHVMLKSSVGCESQGNLIVKQICFDSKHAFYYLIHALERFKEDIKAISFINILDMKQNPLKSFSEQIRTLPNLKELSFINVLFSDQNILQVRYLLNWKQSTLTKLVFKRAQFSEFQLKKLFLDGSNFSISDLTHLREAVFKCHSKTGQSSLFQQIKNQLNQIVQNNEKINSKNEYEKKQLLPKQPKYKLFEPKRVKIKSEQKEWIFSSFNKEISQPLKMLFFQLSQTNFCQELDIAAISLIGTSSEILGYLIKAVCDSLSLNILKIQNYPDLLGMLLNEFRDKNQIHFNMQENSGEASNIFSKQIESVSKQLPNKNKNSILKIMELTSPFHNKKRSNSSGTSPVKTQTMILSKQLKRVKENKLSSIVEKGKNGDDTGNNEMKKNNKKLIQNPIDNSAEQPFQSFSPKKNQVNKSMKKSLSLPQTPSSDQKNCKDDVFSSVIKEEIKSSPKIKDFNFLLISEEQKNKEIKKNSDSALLLKKRRMLQELHVKASAFNEFGETSCFFITGLMQYSQKVVLDFSNSYLSKEGMNGFLEGFKNLREQQSKNEGVELKELIISNLSGSRRVNFQSWLYFGAGLMDSLSLNSIELQKITLKKEYIDQIIKGMLQMQFRSKLIGIKKMVINVNTDEDIEVVDFMNLFLDQMTLEELKIAWKKDEILGSQTEKTKYKKNYSFSNIGSSKFIYSHQINNSYNPSFNPISVTHKSIVPSHFSIFLSPNNEFGEKNRYKLTSSITNNMEYMHATPSLNSISLRPSQTLQILQLSNFINENWTNLFQVISTCFVNLKELNLSENQLTLEFITILLKCDSFWQLQNLEKLFLNQNYLRIRQQVELFGTENDGMSFKIIDSPSQIKNQCISVLNMPNSQAIKGNPAPSWINSQEIVESSKQKEKPNIFGLQGIELTTEEFNGNQQKDKKRNKQNTESIFLGLQDFSFTKQLDAPNGNFNYIQSEKILFYLLKLGSQNSFHKLSGERSNRIQKCEDSRKQTSQEIKHQTMIEFFAKIFDMTNLSQLDLSDNGFTNNEVDIIEAAMQNKNKKNFNLNFNTINLSGNEEIDPHKISQQKLKQFTKGQYFIGTKGIDIIEEKNEIKVKQEQIEKNQTNLLTFLSPRNVNLQLPLTYLTNHCKIEIIIIK